MTQDDLQRETMRRAVELAIVKAVAKCGSHASAAEELGVSRQLLHSWKQLGRVSGKYARPLARLSGVPVEDLRPDLYGPMRSDGGSLGNGMAASAA